MEREGSTMIKIIDLIRLEDNEQHGTFGVLKIDRECFCVTLELPWRDNQKNISAIPARSYSCQRIISPKFGETFEVLRVPDRSKVLLHAGNVDDDTHGCILLGQYFGKLRENRAVLNSGNTFRQFMSAMAGLDTFFLRISKFY